MGDRFALFTGWELQCLARGVAAQDDLEQRRPQSAAQQLLMDEIHNEFDIREGLKFTDPMTTRASVVR